MPTPSPTPLDWFYPGFGRWLHNLPSGTCVRYRWDDARYVYDLDADILRCLVLALHITSCLFSGFGVGSRLPCPILLLPTIDHYNLIPRLPIAPPLPHIPHTHTFEHLPRSHTLLRIYIHYLFLHYARRDLLPLHHYTLPPATFPAHTRSHFIATCPRSHTATTHLCHYFHCLPAVTACTVAPVYLYTCILLPHLPPTLLPRLEHHCRLHHHRTTLPHGLLHTILPRVVPRFPVIPHTRLLAHTRLPHTTIPQFPTTRLYAGSYVLTVTTIRTTTTQHSRTFTDGTDSGIWCGFRTRRMLDGRRGFWRHHHDTSLFTLQPTRAVALVLAHTARSWFGLDPALCGRNSFTCWFERLPYGWLVPHFIRRTRLTCTWTLHLPPLHAFSWTVPKRRRITHMTATTTRVAGAGCAFAVRFSFVCCPTFTPNPTAFLPVPGDPTPTPLPGYLIWTITNI